MFTRRAFSPLTVVILFTTVLALSYGPAKADAGSGRGATFHPSWVTRYSQRPNGSSRARQQPNSTIQNQDVEALGSAAFGRKVDAVKELLAKGTDANSKTKNGMPILIHAVGGGSTEVIELLLSSGADVNAKDSQGQSALWFAAWEGQGEVVHLLLDRGADVNTSSNDGRTALMRAVIGGKSEPDQIRMIKVMLDKGANVNAQDKARENALIAAINGGRLEVVHFLIERGADVNAKAGPKANFGMTALMNAAYWGQVKMVELLLAKGADVNAKGYKGETALMIASKGKHQQVVELLKKAGATE